MASEKGRALPPISCFGPIRELLGPCQFVVLISQSGLRIGRQLFQLSGPRRRGGRGFFVRSFFMD